MTTAIIGTGNIDGTLARHLVRGGESGMNSRVGKIREIHQEDPGRIHVVLIRQQIGF